LLRIVAKEKYSNLNKNKFFIGMIRHQCFSFVGLFHVMMMQMTHQLVYDWLIKVLQ
jgi:hypothetical protein